VPLLVREQPGSSYGFGQVSNSVHPPFNLDSLRSFTVSSFESIAFSISILLEWEIRISNSANSPFAQRSLATTWSTSSPNALCALASSPLAVPMKRSVAIGLYLTKNLATTSNLSLSMARVPTTVGTMLRLDWV